MEAACWLHLPDNQMTFSEVEAQLLENKSNRFLKTRKRIQKAEVFAAVLVLTVLVFFFFRTIPRYPVCQKDVLETMCSDEHTRGAGYTCADEKQRFLFECLNESQLRLIGCINGTGTTLLIEPFTLPNYFVDVHSSQDNLVCDQDNRTLSVEY